MSDAGKVKRRDTTLYAYWSKREKDIMFCYPRKVDGALLHWQFGKHPESLSEPFNLSKTLFQELDARGYDLTTFKFSIKRKPLP